MGNNSFREGFMDGFTAPFTFLKEKPSGSGKYQTRVGRALEDVGAAFYEVMRKEGISVGKERNAKRRARKRAA